jgi:hypothetical protein
VPAHVTHELFRYMIFALMLAWMYAIAGLNKFEIAVPKSASVNPVHVLLNTVAWIVALSEILRFCHPRHDPLHMIRYQFLANAIAVCVLTLGIASFVTESSKYVAMLAVVPIVVMLSYYIMIGAQWRKRWFVILLAAFGVIAGATFPLVILGPGYAGVMGSTAAFACMFVAQFFLLFVLFGMALMQEPDHVEGQPVSQHEPAVVPSAAQPSVSFAIAKPKPMGDPADWLRDPDSGDMI